MNVLFLANGGSLYGANRSMLDLILGLQSQGDKVFVLLPTRGNITIELRRKKIPYKIVEYQLSVHKQSEKFNFQRFKNCIQNISCIKKIVQFVEEWEIDIIHINSVVIDIGAYAAIIARVPYVWHVREMLDKDYELVLNTPFLQKILMKHSSKVICISKAVYKNFKGYIFNNGVVMYNGFNTCDYEDTKDIMFEHNKINLLLCGMIIKGKGQMDAIRAAHKLVVKGYNISLNIVGSVADKEYHGEIKKYILDNNLQDHIHVLPFQQDLREMRRKADIALMCSENEALGRVTIEAMLSELVVIGTNSGGTTEIIREGYNGFLYSSHDISELVNKIEYVINNKEKSLRTGKRARLFAKKGYDNFNYASSIHDIYFEIVGNHKSY